jgi:exopolyphosphatase/guanosine-5'-triphosphate,3'-diphosphate pyrophosphatase
MNGFARRAAADNKNIFEGSMAAYVRPRWRREAEGKAIRRIGRMAHTYAAIDLGTNNCRLLVAQPLKKGFRVIDAFSRIVRLGEGLGATGVLSEAAMSRTVEALRVCASKMRRRRVGRARLVATDACRRATNGAGFLDRVEAQTGLRLEVISSETEAGLALRGCAPLFVSDKRRALVFDIGGGSTEMTVVDTTAPAGGNGESGAGGHSWMSMPFGVVGLTERYGGDAMSRDAYVAMIDDIDRSLAPFCAENGIAGSARDGDLQMLGASGTVTTLTGVHLDLPRYDRDLVDGAYLDFDAIHAVSDRLRAMECAERAKHPCIGIERADLVVAGCAILEAMCRRWPVGRIRVADRGLREGILLDLMGAAEREAARRGAT